MESLFIKNEQWTILWCLTHRLRFRITRFLDMIWAINLGSQSSNKVVLKFSFPSSAPTPFQKNARYKFNSSKKFPPPPKLIFTFKITCHFRLEIYIQPPSQFESTQIWSVFDERLLFFINLFFSRPSNVQTYTTKCKFKLNDDDDKRIKSFCLT